MQESRGDEARDQAHLADRDHQRALQDSGQEHAQQAAGSHQGQRGPHQVLRGPVFGQGVRGEGGPLVNLIICTQFANKYVFRPLLDQFNAPCSLSIPRSCTICC